MRLHARLLMMVPGAVIALLAGQNVAEASTIFSFNAGVAGGGTNAQAPGQQVTTPSGGPWDNIIFNFYDGNGNPVALQTIYLLSVSYAGTAAALSTFTPGFIASAVGGGAGGAYVFAASVTLQPTTSYYFYSSALTPSEWGFNANFGPALPGFVGYGAANGGTSSSYTTRPFTQAFNLQGTATSTTTPEPATLPLVAVALGMLGLCRWRLNRTTRTHA